VIIDGIDQSWKCDVELANARVRDMFALGVGGRIAEQDAFFHIAFHLPDVGGMRLSNVHDIEGGLILVIGVEFVERGNLPAKWRSSVASEDENHRFHAAEG